MMFGKAAGGAKVNQRTQRVRRGQARAGISVLCVLFLVALAVVGAGSPAGASVAAGPVDCSQAVADTSGVVDVNQVVNALAAVDPAATVVVRSYDTVPNADLTAVVDDLVLACFGDADSGLRPDVIVLAVSVGDRRSDVVIGERWRPAFPQPDQLRVDVMGRFFSNNNFTGGLVAAADEIAAQIDDQLLSEADQSSGTGSSGGSDGVDSDEAVGGQADGVPDAAVPDAAVPDGDGESPWAIGGGAAALALGGGTFYMINRQRRLAAARRELDQAMAGPIGRHGTLRERDGRLIGQADVWRRTSAGRTTDALAAMIRRLDTTRTETDKARRLLTTATPDGPNNAGLQELERARTKVLDLSKALDDHDESLDRLEALGAHLDHLRIAVPAKAQLLQEELGESHELADQRQSEGWSVESSRKDLQRVAATIEAMDFSGLELDLLTMSDQIEEAEALLFATNHYVQSLPSRLGALKEWTDGLDSAAGLELRRIDELRREFSTLATSHASDSWQWAADLPEQAVDHLNRCDEIQERVITELVPNQDFDGAGRELDRAGLELIAADRLLDQVDDLMVDLEQARQQAPSLVAESRRVLRDLAQFVSHHHGDLGADSRAAPDQLAAAIAGVEQELNQLKPNYLRVAETADRINRQLDEVLARAQDEKLRMESLRRERDREIGRANRAIRRARRSIGWELFKSNDGRALDGLEDRLQGLPGDVEQAIVAAADVADDALRIQERVIARRRRRSTWVSTGGGGWTSGGGGWSSGGGGRSRSSRSGGSRSFGGVSSRSGGGRSFGSGRSSGSF